MRTLRFYTSQPLAIAADVSLEKAQSNHISRVLRMTAGQTITLFNGDGYDYQAEIITTGKVVQVRVNEKLDNLANPIHEVHLVQGLARGDRMDYAIQKAVEMGVTEITPLVTEYVQIRLDAKRMAKKYQHWRGVITSALEQCGRADSVILNETISFSDWLNQAGDDCLYLHPRTSNKLTDAAHIKSPDSEQKLTVVIGPEGGFSDAEIAQVKAEQIFAIGPRILRTETAATAVLAVLQHYFLN